MFLSIVLESLADRQAWTGSGTSANDEVLRVISDALADLCAFGVISLFLVGVH